MSTSTIPDDGTEQEIRMEKQILSSSGSPLAVTRTESKVDKALDAEANIDDAAPPDEEIPISNADASNEPGPPPNGGFRAWLQVAGSFFLFFNSW